MAAYDVIVSSYAAPGEEPMPAMLKPLSRPQHPVHAGEPRGARATTEYTSVALLVVLGLFAAVAERIHPHREA